jgi:hypothetical protein
VSTGGGVEAGSSNGVGVEALGISVVVADFANAVPGGVGVISNG